MTPEQFLQEKNIDTQYVEAFTDRGGWLHIPLEQLLNDYAKSIQLMQTAVVGQSEQLIEITKN